MPDCRPFRTKTAKFTTDPSERELCKALLLAPGNKRSTTNDLPKEKRIGVTQHPWRSASVPSGVYPRKRPCLASGLYSGDTISTQAAPLSESSPRQTRESRPCTQPPPRCDSRADLSKRRCLACESCRHHAESGLAPLLHAP